MTNDRGPVTPTRQHLTTIELSALDGGIPSDARRQDLLAHIQRCPDCNRLHESYQQAADAFETRVVPRTLPRVRQRVARARLFRRRFAIFFAPVPVMAAVAIAISMRPVPLPVSPGAGQSPTGLGIKGRESLQIYVKHDARVFPLSDGAVLGAGDAIRFLIDPGSFTFAIVGSVDGAGKASIYFPSDGQLSARIELGRRLELPGSVVLDQAPGPERVFAVFSREPIRTDVFQKALADLGKQGQEAIRKARKLPIPGTAQATLHFEKNAAAP